MKFTNIRENVRSWRTKDKGAYYKYSGTIISSRKENPVFKEGEEFSKFYKLDYYAVW